MIKEKLHNTVETVLNKASIAYNCVLASVDTIRDKEVIKAWKAKECQTLGIRIAARKDLLELYLKYKEECSKIELAAKEAKKEVNEQFNNIVKESFNSHLENRQSSKMASNRELVVQ